LATAPRESDLRITSAEVASGETLHLLTSEPAVVPDKPIVSKRLTHGPAEPLWYVARDAPLRHIDLLKDVIFAILNLSLVLSWWSVSHQLEGLNGVLSIRGTGGHANTQYILFLILYATLTVLACDSNGLYRPVAGRTVDVMAIARSTALATLLLTLIFYLSVGSGVPVLAFVAGGVLNVVTFSAWRSWDRYSLQHRTAVEKRAQPVIIVGAGPLGQTIAERITANPHLGYVVAGFVDDEQDGSDNVLGSIGELANVARQRFASEVVIARSLAPKQLRDLVSQARSHHMGVRFVPDVSEQAGRPLPVDYWGGIPVLSLHREPIPTLALFVKRSMDVLISGIGLVVLSPMLLAIGVAVKLDSPGSALYRSRRAGKKGRMFVCYKFRTMVANADDLKEKLMALNERQGPFFKISRDPRRTRLGRWLRKYSLDEVPQLWNVFIGDMSLVGPRPPDVEETKYYRVEYLRRLDVKPGITGLWQVTARRDPSFEKALGLDIEYIENWTPWLDCRILLKTIPTVLRGSGQ
jgi:exopolysaccharide biosynthesis polyprenyl glycosylphosphotransferase